MKGISGFTNIRKIVLSIKLNMQQYDMDEYSYWEQMVIKALEYFHIFSVNSTKVAYLKNANNGVIDLPSDFVDYYKVAVRFGGGQLWTLTLNPNLVKGTLEKCGETINDVLGKNGGVPTEGYYFSEHFYNGVYIDTMYSLGGGFNTSYFNIDRFNNKLLVEGLPSGAEIILEYKNSGISSEGETFIPKFMEEAIIDWCVLKAISFRVIPLDLGYWMKKQNQSETLLENFVYKQTIEEWGDVLASTYKQSAKIY